MAEENKEKFDNYKYQQQYIKENVKFLHVPFNKKFPDELALFTYLDEHAKKTGEKKATYIKRLIREDMESVSPLYSPSFNDDISFCQEECDDTNCMRNSKNIMDRTVPHSYIIGVPKDCPKKLFSKEVIPFTDDE